ncbi:MAG: UvrD-helicase domain-containing protein [Bacilli bacterium]
MNLTPEQQLAVDLEGTNIIVSAGAGSGKTAVLSERVIRKLKDGIDIRNILMLTFTNEAAGEMANRIRKKIKKAGLTSQLEFLDQAYITTFDAFALSLVKKYHYVLNIDKSIDIIDSSIIDLKRNEFLEEIFLSLYEAKDEKFLKLIGDFTTRDDEVIKKAILSINKSLDLKYDKEDYIDNYINNFYNNKYIEQLFAEYFNYLKKISLELEDSVLILENFMDSSSYENIYNSLSKLFRPNCYNDLYKNNNIILPRFTKVDSSGISVKENIQELFKELNELVIYSEDELKNNYFCTRDYVEVILKIIKMLDEKISLYKKEHNSYEFTDIAKMAISIVKDNEDIRLELKDKFNEIMIDEYQDTNDLQETFIKLLENDNVYMVGDIKQSIYRFRNANPLIFKDKYDRYSINNGGKKIDLLKNFRSREEVLYNINEIFAPLMTQDIGGINYKESHAMVYGNKAYIEKGANDYNNYLDILTYNNEDKKYTNDEIEAFIIAKDIKKKIEEKYLVFDFDKECNRDVTYNDFCIILDRGSKMSLFKKVFEYLDIPMEVYKDNNLIEENDIFIIKNIIGLILSIKDGIYNKKLKYYFTSVARSYIGNLCDNEIFKCFEENKIFKTDIYNKCYEISKDIDIMTPNILLKRIIKDFDFYDKFILVGNVDAAIKRINYLLELSKNVENLGFSIIDFSNYLNEMIDSDQEIKYKEAKSNSISVKIMNIHKSKGLEFPICYFAGFPKTFNISDLKNKFMFDNKYGILTPFYKEGIGETFVKTLVKNNYYLNEVAEKIRLFYVALTRAKEKMIMVMPNIDDKKYVKDEISFMDGIKFRSFYDFIKSISGNLAKYMISIDLNNVGVTKDYEFSKSLSKNMVNNEEANMLFIEDEIPFIEIEKKHASKTIKEILSVSDEKTLEFGTKIHELLELTDFKNANTDNKYVNHLLNTFDFNSAKIYQELEFSYELDDVLYHGIIDLMLEYEDKIFIIDYKLKNIDDENYIKQLNVYYNYVKCISNKDVHMYLYSILDNVTKEII